MLRQFECVVCAFLFCGSGAMAATGYTSHQASAGSKEDLSVLAGKVLNDTNEARLAIKDSNATAAKQDVARAQRDLTVLNSHAQGATTIPVYKEFVSLSILTPVEAEHNARLKKEGGPAVVHQVAADYTDVNLNTTVARQNLKAAADALQGRNLVLADAALADVQQGVTINQVEANLPLARARANLILARAAAEKENYSEAKAALNAASKALASFGSEGGPHADEARNLEQQIESFDRNLQQNRTGAVSKINQWWNQTSNWNWAAKTQASAMKQS